MTTVRLIEYQDAEPAVRAVYDDIRATRKTDFINNFWKALANNPAQLASTSARVHAALLAAAVDIPHLEATPHDDLGVRVRLLRPVASWISTTRDDVAGLLRDSLEFQLRGELEQHVVIGQPEPAGIIEKIVYRDDR